LKIISAMKQIAPLICALTIPSAWAQEPNASEAESTPENRHISVLANYSYFDLLLPSKQGLTIAYTKSSAKTYEFEYLSAKVSVPFVVKDLGSFSEKRASLLSRTFFSEGSFSGYFGLAWNSTELVLGNETLATLSGGAYPDVKLLKIDTLGFNTGLGNRWTVWKGLTLGADWLGWTQPILVLSKQTPVLDVATNASERKVVERVFNTMTYLPRFYFLKCQLGWQF
jgi:hypothetical protein